VDIYIVEGGIGKHIAFSALIPQIASKEDIYIMSSYPDVYNFNPKVRRSLGRNTQYAWEDYITREENTIKYYEPYYCSDFIKGKKHLIEVWCDGYNIEYSKDMLPHVVVNKDMNRAADQFAEANGKFIIIQLTGGQSPYTYNNNNQRVILQRKEYPTHLRLKLIATIRKKYPDLKILEFCLPNEVPPVEGVIRIEAHYLLYVALLSRAEAFIGIDSALQHMAASVQKTGIVLWGGTSPVSFGYDLHINLCGKCSQGTPHCSRPYIREMGDYIGNGGLWSCPDGTCMDIEISDIINKLDILLKD